MCRRTEHKLADGLWRICFINNGRYCAWIVFTEDPREMPIEVLDKEPRVYRDRDVRDALIKLGLGYPKTERARKKALTKFIPGSEQ